MNGPIPPMITQLVNLFPETVKKAAIEIFGEQSMQPVLLRLFPVETGAEQSTTAAGMSALLHPEEKAIFAGYRLAKRRAEYLTGRICAKRAVQSFLIEAKAYSAPPALPEIEITTTTIGRPDVLLHQPLGLKATALKMDISISHSGNYGAALAAESRCGIDLQVQKATLLHVQEKYCSEVEYRLLETSLANYGPLPRLTLLWAAKEAGKKALSYWQMPGFLDLQLCALERYADYVAISLHITNTRNQQLPNKITVVAGLFDDYALAICLVREESSDARTAGG